MKAFTFASIAISALIFSTFASPASAHRASGRDNPIPPSNQPAPQSKTQPQCRRPSDSVTDRRIPRCTLTTLPESQTQPYVPPDNGYPEGTTGSGVR